jgi:hypothetical protein
MACIQAECDSKRVVYNYFGEKKGLYCLAHKLANMVDITTKYCAFPECRKRRLYNICGKTAMYCKDHKSDIMVNRGITLCLEPGCESRPIFNYSNSKKGVYCFSHKKDLMIDVINKDCTVSGCIRKATYSLKGQVAQVCYDHKTDGMIRKTTRFCKHVGCSVSASFNFPGIKKGEFCNEHKLSGMINVIIPRCRYEGCEKYPTYNTIDKKTGIYCLTHKKDGMIPVSSLMCEHEGCRKRPTYGFTRCTHCVIHKIDGMIPTTNDLCIIEGCRIRASYNNMNTPKALYCNKHKSDTMVNVKDRHCIEEGCWKIPSFNVAGRKKGLYCYTHKKADMINVREKICETPMCMTQISSKYNGYCLNCFIHIYPDMPVSRNYKTKEKAVRDYISSVFPTYAWSFDRRIPGSLSYRKPDIVLDLCDHVIIIEVDENQHISYDCTCENKRLAELSLDISHRPLTFIRFNPDKYKDISGNIIKSCWGIDGNGILRVTKTTKENWEFRLSVLKDTIYYWISNISTKTIETIELFYDQAIST